MADVPLLRAVSHSQYSQNGELLDFTLQFADGSATRFEAPHVRLHGSNFDLRSVPNLGTKVPWSTGQNRHGRWATFRCGRD